MAAGMTLNRLRPVYTLVGDEVYFRDRFRAELTALLPPEGIEFSLFDEDLATTPLDEILDRARNPSLMAPLQMFFVRNVKELFGRGAASGAGDGEAKKSAGKKKHGDFPANLERYAREAAGASPPGAVVVFVADHLHLPSDRARMSLEDKGRLQRIEATLGANGEVVSCGRVADTQAIALTQQMAIEQGAELTPEAARALVEMLEGSLGLIRPEVEKLCLHALPGRRVELGAVEAMVTASRVGSAFDLAVRIGRGERARSLECLQRIWAEEGDGGGIGLVYQLGRAFKMALILRQARVRDRSGIYSALPEGLRPPGFAADAILALSRAMAEGRLMRGIQLLHGADVALRSSPPSVALVFERVVWVLTEG